MSHPTLRRCSSFVEPPPPPPGDDDDDDGVIGVYDSPTTTPRSTLESARRRATSGTGPSSDWRGGSEVGRPPVVAYPPSPCSAVVSTPTPLYAVEEKTGRRAT